MIFKRSFVSELANSAGGVFTVLFTIVIAVGMVRILGMAAGGRIDNTAVLQMVLYNALTNLPPLLALSVFVAVLMTLMRWWQDNEMVVWFSSGGRPLTAWISPVLRFALPIVLLIALLAIVISPWAKSQTDLTRQAFKNRDEVNAIVPGRFIESMGGQRVIFIDSAGSKENEVGKVFMAETGKDKESVVTAESGTVEVNEEGDRYVVLHNGRRYETANESAATRLVEFDGYGVRFDLKLDSPMRAGKAATQPFTVLLAADTPESDAELLWRFSCSSGASPGRLPPSIWRFSPCRFPARLRAPGEVSTLFSPRSSSSFISTASRFLKPGSSRRNFRSVQRLLASTASSFFWWCSFSCGATTSSERRAGRSPSALFRACGTAWRAARGSPHEGHHPTVHERNSPRDVVRSDGARRALCVL